MKKLSLFLVLLFLPTALTAKPYYSEHIEFRFFKEFIIIFHGNIPEEDEAKVKILEQKYLEPENLNMRKPIAQELKALGVSIEEIENVDRRRAIKVPHPPEFHHY
ncbi:MAG: hypothetical protein WAM28_03910 [Chlamydiales bacterium]